MTTSIRILLVATLSTIACLGCSANAPADEVEAICRRYADSPDACTDACRAAFARTVTECAAETEAVTAHAEVSPWSECADACPTGRSCTDGDATISQTECGCSAACVAERSESFQQVFEAYTRCIDAVRDDGCY